MKRILILLVMVLGMMLTPSANADSIIWDFGPNDSYTGILHNLTGEQHFYENVKFGSNVKLTGYDHFLRLHDPPNTATNFHLSIRADNGSGWPGDIIYEWDQDYNEFGYYGTYYASWSPTVQSDIYKATFYFDPIILNANTTYWIGASGNGMEGVQLTLYAPGGDGKLFSYNDEGMADGFYTFGDGMFRLLGAPTPEPATILLMAFGTGVMGGGIRRLRRKFKK